MFAIWIEVLLDGSAEQHRECMSKRIQVPALPPVGTVFWPADSDEVCGEPMTITRISYWESPGVYLAEAEAKPLMKVQDWADALESIGWLPGPATDHMDRADSVSVPSA